MEPLIDTKEVAKLTGMSESWFEHQRWLGDTQGPRYLKIGRSVRYKRSDVQDWLEKKGAG